MTEYYAVGCDVIARSSIGDRRYATAFTNADATRIALSLMLAYEASDAELASLVDAGAGKAMVKAYRKELGLMVADVAETSGIDAARVKGGAA